MNSLYSIFILAKLNSSEWIRLKFFHIIIFFGILFIGFSHLLSSLTFSVRERLLYDFGLAGLELALVVIASLIGSHTIQREIDRKTLFVLLSRPIPRSYIVLGAWFSIFNLCALFSIGFLLSLIFSAGEVNYLAGFLIAALSSFLKSMVISSFAIACGLIVRPILALGAALSYWFFCYAFLDIQYFIAKLNNELLLKFLRVLENAIPQFYLYNWKSYYFMLNMPSQSEIAWSIFHSLGWVAFWLLAASIFFRRKEIV